MSWTHLAGVLLAALASVASSAVPLPPAAEGPRPPAQTPPPKASPNLPAVFRARPGPWGELDYFTVYLEASLSTLKGLEMQTYQTAWKFMRYREDQVTKLFQSVKMPDAIRAELLDRTKWQRTDEAVVVSPSSDALLGLPAEARGAIYQVLAQWEENPFHHEPNVAAGQNVRTWLQRSDLSEEILAAIEKTAYPRGKNLVFSDLPLLLRMVKTEGERLQIRKALSRTPTLIVKLRLSPETDIAKLADYWGGYTRSKDILPFLESVSEIPGSNVIDLIHLLPTGVRRLLYTYPNPSHGRTGYYPDCHWSSLNFANFDPLDRLGDPAMATAYTLENYTVVPAGKPYDFGDVLFFMNGSSGDAIHSCVYLADDIVFTKNGRSPTQPWVLMKLEDVINQYSMYYQPQIACYRRKAS